MLLLLSLYCVLCAVNSVVSINSSENFNDIQNKDVRRWFRLMDAELKSLNKYTSIIAWELSVNPSESLGEMGVQLNGIRSDWQKGKCEEILGIIEPPLETKVQRAVNLLCRGPRFSPTEAKALSRAIAEMQNTYTDTQICLPKDINACQRPDSLWDFTFIRPPGDGGLYWMNLRDFVQGEAPAKASKYFNIISSNMRFVCFDGEPDLERLMTGDFAVVGGCAPKNPETIYHWAWEAWRVAVGIPIGNVYPTAVALMNRGAQNAGYHDTGAIWREELEMEDLEGEMKALWSAVEPLYALLHAVVRHFLVEKYRNNPLGDFTEHGKIPAHILGNMWSQNWASLHSLLMPDVNLDLEANIRATNWTALDMVEHAEDFFTSVGLRKMPRKFWQYSQFEKSNATRCHGTAANMFMPDDYRMIVCAEKTLEDFYVIHHEFGHLAYYSAYRNQPTIFQEGTNSAFQEAIGDALFNGVMTPQHLNRLALLPDEYLLPSNNTLTFDFVQGIGAHRRTRETHNMYDISILLRIALAKIPQIPFEYILDVFRWRLFSGKVDPLDANDYFWALTELHQGIRAPGHGDRHRMFDAGAKFHVADNTPYVRYFLASIIQMQIFKGLCQMTIFDRVAPEEPLPMPLHRCDIYGSKRAGKILRKSLSLGASVHWTEVLKILTGSEKISAEPLLEYYKPLIDWLQHTIHKFDIPVGW